MMQIENTNQKRKAIFKKKIATITILVREK
jgi:hypothetical protein